MPRHQETRRFDAEDRRTGQVETGRHEIVRHEIGTPAGPGALRSLVGAGPSQVGVVGALRARDVSRPTEADLRRAEAAPTPPARPGAGAGV